jgi:L,D-transpeptidase ErfK/SrfK
MLYNDTPIHTTLSIVNQPYLIGQRNGVLYMEAHAPKEDPAAGPVELKKVFAKLRGIEKKTGQKLDWKKIQEVQAEARGIPVPISEIPKESEGDAAKTIELRHPGKWFGRPETPELRLDAWYVLAADVRDQIDAQKMAAILNHQGPQIPARVVSKRDGYRVLAGPFSDIGVANNALRRLKVDLQIDGVLIAPVKKIDG